MQLTSRERVLRTFARQPVDRCTIALGAHCSTGISAFAYVRLVEHLGLPERQIRIIDPGQHLRHERRPGGAAGADDRTSPV